VIFSDVFSFPDQINEKAARTVAFVVMALAIFTLATGWYWLTVVLAYGFIARVLTGPTLSPLGRLASTLIAPRLGTPKLVSGPPKRFAQAIGALFTIGAAVAALGFDEDTVADVLLVMLVLAAGLESILAFCVGCRIFGLLMKLGVIPEEVCERCADIWASPTVAPSTE
jgi:Domain of unknown function (DUF4395)